MAALFEMAAKAEEAHEKRFERYRIQLLDGNPVSRGEAGRVALPKLQTTCSSAPRRRRSAHFARIRRAFFQRV